MRFFCSYCNSVSACFVLFIGLWGMLQFTFLSFFFSFNAGGLAHDLGHLHAMENQESIENINAEIDKRYAARQEVCIITAGIYLVILIIAVHQIFAQKFHNDEIEYRESLAKGRTSVPAITTNL